MKSVTYPLDEYTAFRILREAVRIFVRGCRVPSASTTQSRLGNLCNSRKAA